MDVTMAVGSTARWTVTFDHGSRLMQVAQGDRDSLAAGLRKLFTEATRRTCASWSVGLLLPAVLPRHF
jgi:hypothetical protein